MDAILGDAEKGLMNRSENIALSTNLDLLNELTSFEKIVSLDNRKRAKGKKIAGLINEITH